MPGSIIQAHPPRSAPAVNRKGGALLAPPFLSLGIIPQRSLRTNVRITRGGTPALTAGVKTTKPATRAIAKQPRTRRKL
jgi:hypothetical protein